MDGDRGDAELCRSTKRSNRDLSTIGNKYLLNHGCPFSSALFALYAERSSFSIGERAPIVKWSMSARFQAIFGQPHGDGPDPRLRGDDCGRG